MSFTDKPLRQPDGSLLCRPTFVNGIAAERNNSPGALHCLQSVWESEAQASHCPVI